MDQTQNHSQIKLISKINEVVKIPLLNATSFQSIPSITIANSNIGTTTEISIEDFLSDNSFSIKMENDNFEISPQTAVSSYFNFDSMTAAKYEYGTLDYHHPNFSFEKRRSSLESNASDTTIVSDDIDEKSFSSPNSESRRPSIEFIPTTPKMAALTPKMDNIYIPHAAESTTSKIWTCFMPDCSKQPYTTAAGLRYHIKHFHHSNLSVRVKPKEKKNKTNRMEML